MTRLDRETALSILGEGIHTSLRKGGEGKHSNAAWRAIEEMPNEEWRGVLEFLLDGLESMGIELVAKAQP